MITFNLVDKILLRSNNQNLGGKCLSWRRWIHFTNWTNKNKIKKYITENIKVYKRGTEIILAK